MATKSKPTTSSGSQLKKRPSVLTLKEKLPMVGSLTAAVSATTVRIPRGFSRVCLTLSNVSLVH